MSRGGVGGQYCEDCHVAELQEEGRGGARGYIRDPEHAKALWAKSEEMVVKRSEAQPVKAV